jgi:hypothetical protein
MKGGKFHKEPPFSHAHFNVDGVVVAEKRGPVSFLLLWVLYAEGAGGYDLVRTGYVS